MTNEEQITVDPDICFGKPCIKGTRISVSLILELVEAGLSIEKIMEEYPHLTKGEKYRKGLVSLAEAVKMVDKITIKLPADLLELTGLNSKNLEEKSLLIWILEIYEEGKITLSKAANLLNMKVDEFLSEFHKRHLKHVGGPESVKEVQNDYDVVQKLINDE